MLIYGVTGNNPNLTAGGFSSMQICSDNKKFNVTNGVTQ